LFQDEAERPFEIAIVMGGHDNNEIDYSDDADANPCRNLHRDPGL